MMATEPKPNSKLNPRSMSLNNGLKLGMIYPLLVALMIFGHTLL